MKTLNLAILTGFLLAISAPAFAEDAPALPTTKDACEKLKDMKWDASTMACVKK
jgi:hypothetical protein